MFEGDKGARRLSRWIRSGYGFASQLEAGDVEMGNENLAYWLLPPLLAFGFFIALVVLRESGAITGIITSDLGH